MLLLNQFWARSAGLSAPTVDMDILNMTPEAPVSDDEGGEDEDSDGDTEYLPPMSKQPRRSAKRQDLCLLSAQQRRTLAHAQVPIMQQMKSLFNEDELRHEVDLVKVHQRISTQSGHTPDLRGLMDDLRNSSARGARVAVEFQGMFSKEGLPAWTDAGAAITMKHLLQGMDKVSAQVQGQAVLELANRALRWEIAKTHAFFYEWFRYVRQFGMAPDAHRRVAQIHRPRSCSVPGGRS